MHGQITDNITILKIQLGTYVSRLSIENRGILYKIAVISKW